MVLSFPFLECRLVEGYCNLLSEFVVYRLNWLE